MMRNVITTFVAVVVGLFSGHVPVCHGGAPYPDSPLIIRENSKGKG